MEASGFFLNLEGLTIHDEGVTFFENSGVDLSGTCLYKFFSKAIVLTRSGAKLPPESSLDQKPSTLSWLHIFSREKGNRSKKELKRYRPDCKAIRTMQSISQAATGHTGLPVVYLPGSWATSPISTASLAYSGHRAGCEIPLLVWKIWKSCCMPVPRALGQAVWTSSELMAGFRRSDISQGRAKCQELGCHAGREPFPLASLPFLLMPGRKKMNFFLSRDPLRIRA